MKTAISFCFAIALVAGQAAKSPSTETSRKVKVLELASVAGPEQCEAIAGYLTDQSYDVRIEAASSLYWKCDRSRIGAKFGPALCRSIQLGNADAGAYLLLGYAPLNIAKPCLQKAARGKGNEMVKLVTSSKPVPASLAATVALARLGDAPSLAKLRGHFDKPSIDTGVFLLATLPNIDDRDCLRAATKLLDDKRDAPGVIAHASRTLRDVALEALAAKLQIKPSFAISPGTRYSDDQVSEFRKAADLALGRP